jgi:hypothetical protein
VKVVAATLPADPSRAEKYVRIHHHGSEAPTVVMPVIQLRILSFTRLPIHFAEARGSSKPHTTGNMTLALLLWRGSN